jgi:iron complex outermembrane recepter protein
VGAGSVCRNQFTIRNFSNAATKPEESKQLALGVVFEPSRNFSMGVDYWYADIDNLIGTIGGNTILNAYRDDPTGPFSSLIVRNAPAAGQTIGRISFVNNTVGNFRALQTSGVDVNTRFRFPRTSMGNFELEWNGTYTIKQDTQLKAFGRVFRGEAFTAISGEDPLIRFRNNTRLDWQSGNWGATLGYNWQSSYLQSYTDQNVGQTKEVRVNSWETTDLQVRYTGFKGLTMRVGARNLADKSPPFTPQDGTFQVGYDPSYADPRGRILYVRGTYQF